MLRCIGVCKTPHRAGRIFANLDVERKASRNIGEILRQMLLRKHENIRNSGGSNRIRLLVVVRNVPERTEDRGDAVCRELGNPPGARARQCE